MLNDTDLETAPYLTKEQVSKLAFEQGLAILYHGVTSHRCGALTWEEAMQAVAILACQALKDTQNQLIELKHNTVSPLRIVR